VSARKKSKPGSRKKFEREQPLSEQDILDEALQLIRARGIEALSMRGLAQELGVSPMAIYYYVPNKERLLLRVAEALLQAVPTPEPSPAHWEQQMRECAISVWELLSSCPGLSRIVLERPPIKASRRIAQHLFSLLRAAGFDERTTMLGLITFQTYLAGVLAVQAATQRQVRPGAKRRRPLAPDDRRLLERFAQIPPREFMTFGLESVITGIRTHQPAGSGKTRARLTQRARAAGAD
jgi:AcrR family transcriptional regulator